MPKAKKIGRPKLPKGHAKGSIRPVRFSEAELRQYEKVAKASEHKTLSSWIRHTLRDAGMDVDDQIRDAAKEVLAELRLKEVRISVDPDQRNNKWGVKFFLGKDSPPLILLIDTDELHGVSAYKREIRSFLQSRR